MKQIDQNLLEEIGKSESTLALMVKIIRKDNTEYNFTNFNKNIFYDGRIYKPSGSFIPTSFQQVGDLSVDTIEIQGYYEEGNITEKDLLLELFYDAKIWVFIINYKDVNQGEIKLLYGSLGEAKLFNNYFSIEFRNLTYKLTRKIANLYSKTCRAEFGDSKCGVSIVPNIWSPNTIYAAGTAVRPSIDNGRRYECIVGGKSGTTEPTWFTSIGANQQEASGLTWLVKDSIKKSTISLSPFLYRLRITKSSSPIRIKEVKFFDNTDTRIYPNWCEADPWGNCNNTQDNNDSTYYETSTPFTINIVYYFSEPGINFKNFEILLDNGSFIEEFEMQVSYDNGNLYDGTWNTIYSFKGSASYWSSIAYNLVVPQSNIVFNIRNKFNMSIPYQDISYINNALITWTSGNNAGFSIEVKEYDSTNYVLSLFSSVPYNIKYGDNFEITAGCNHLFIGKDGTTSTGDCVSKYNNGINFRGEPHVPTEDVLVGGIGETNRAPNT